MGYVRIAQKYLTIHYKVASISHRIILFHVESAVPVRFANALRLSRIQEEIHLALASLRTWPAITPFPPAVEVKHPQYR